jgi:hypothetical protein
VGRELAAARERALRAGLDSIEDERSAIANTVREEFAALLSAGGHGRTQTIRPLEHSPHRCSGVAPGRAGDA